MKKVLAFFLCLISLLFNVTAFATELTEVYTGDLVANVGDTIIIPVNIKNNNGIMGFKLTFTYDTNCFNVVTVDRGELTKTGNFNHNLTDKSGTFDVVWNNSDESKDDGSLLFLQVEIKKLEDNKVINISYSKEDTFNENWQDLDIRCNPIKFLQSDSSTVETTTTTETTEKSKEQKIDSAYIKTAVEAAKKQAQIEKISELTDVEKDAFIESVNFYLSAFTGTIDNGMDSIDSITTEFDNSLAERFVESSLECVDPSEIVEITESILDKMGFKSINSIPENQKRSFANAVYEKLNVKSEDITVLPENDDCAYKAVVSLYEQVKETFNPVNWWVLLIVLMISLVAILLIVFSAIRIKNKKLEVL